MEVPVELKIKYLSRRLQDIERLRASLELDDYTYVQKVGHQVKGNAETFDIPQIAPLGVQMEQAALLKDKAKVQVIIQQMESIIHTARSRV